jgi:hypothetical protein
MSWHEEDKYVEQIITLPPSVFAFVVIQNTFLVTAGWVEVHALSQLLSEHSWFKDMLFTFLPSQFCWCKDFNM